LLGALQFQFKGTRQAGVDLGQHAQRQLICNRNRHFPLGKERQECLKIVENGAGAAFINGQFPQHAFVFW